MLPEIQVVTSAAFFANSLMTVKMNARFRIGEFSGGAFHYSCKLILTAGNSVFLQFFVSLVKEIKHDAVNIQRGADSQFCLRKLYTCSLFDVVPNISLNRSPARRSLSQLSRNFIEVLDKGRVGHIAYYGDAQWLVWASASC